MTDPIDVARLVERLERGTCNETNCDSWECQRYRQASAALTALCEELSSVRSTNAALREAERGAAERMRERCASIADDYNWVQTQEIARRIRALPLEVDDAE